jgi:hypothetical protein
MKSTSHPWADVPKPCATPHSNTQCDAPREFIQTPNEPRAMAAKNKAFRVPVLYLYLAFQAFHAFQDAQFVRILSDLEPTVCPNPLFRKPF